MRIAVLYSIAPTWGIKYKHWHDGFTAALDILEKTHTVHRYNFYNTKTINCNDYDIVLLKESFNGRLFEYCKNYFSKNTKKCAIGLCISSSFHVPTPAELAKYDILFYETEWYFNYAKLNRHKYAFHAFGVDTSVMKPTEEEKIYDIISVGQIHPMKRFNLLLKRGGNRIILGALSDKSLVDALRHTGVSIHDFVTYEELASYYNKSKLCYIPCPIHGGGERAVLEARACGIPIEIEPDNHKLKELLTSGIWSSEYYALQLEKGASSFLAAQKLSHV
jgi:glycosyltransferase involved in cell wall biosynthesis